MQLLVGLGNPGPSYARHRHNVGFMALDRIAERYAFPGLRKRFHGLYGEGKVDRHRVMLLKPLTYMNDSGRAVGEAMRFHRLPLSEVFVFHDDVDLAPGKVKAKLGGGSAGHNGLRSIDAHLGAEYWRVRIGVGRPPGMADVSNWVLRNFASGDEEWLDPLFDAIADSLPWLLAGDGARFMSEIARLTQPQKPKTRKTAPADEQ